MPSGLETGPMPQLGGFDLSS